ncbi:MAG: DMT family transporter [Lachnospiraceae bacterium]
MKHTIIRRNIESTKTQLMQKTIVIWFMAMICCVLWGSAFPCIKIGYQMFHISKDAIGSQILFAGYRFTIAGVLSIVIGSILNGHVLIPQRKSYMKIGKLSLMQTVAQYLFFYIGLAHTEGVKASIIGGTNVFIAILMASLLFKQEKLTIKKVVGCTFGFLGLVLINITGIGLHINMHFLGEGFMLLSSISFAFSSIYLKQYTKTEDPVILSGYQFIVGGLIMILIGFVTGGQIQGFTLESTAMLIYLAFISAVAFSLWGILLKYNPVSKVAVFNFMNPICGVLWSAALLGEKNNAFGAKSLIALGLVCTGIYVVNYSKMDVPD